MKNNKHYRETFPMPNSGRRWLQSISGICALALVAVPNASDADSVKKQTKGQEDPFEALAEDGLQLKRSKNTGKGMPSIRGPFPDTIGMEFLGQLTNAELGATRLIWTGASFLSDIWGWTDPKTDDEYAIVGTTSGVAFVRITNPRDPEYLGIVPTTNPDTLRNFWWDIKTHNGYAYWTTEVPNAGVAIFDLSRLNGLTEVPAGTRLDVNARYHGNGYVAAHNISINEETGFAYLTGVTKDPEEDSEFVDEGMVILDLNDNPLAPVEVGQVLGRDTHDAQIVTYRGLDKEHEGKEIAFVFNGEDLTVGIYDVTRKGVVDVRMPNSITISETSYPGASFTHQGWLTEDHEFLVVGDEEDELFGISDPRNELLPDTARTYILDVRDLDKPEFHGHFDSPAASIDHNLFVKGDKVYQAHYTAGIRVLDAKEISSGTLMEIAHMDTEPRLPNKHMNNNVNIWVGPWGVFPFFDSGSIIASDGLNGLIIMKLSD